LAVLLIALLIIPVETRFCTNGIDSHTTRYTF
jgi:hypothetical protein